MITKEIEVIEKTSFNINNMVIKFKFAELPNDMKMLAYLAGSSQIVQSTFQDLAKMMFTM